MDLDELKQKWQEYDDQLKSCDLINEQPVRHFLRVNTPGSSHNSKWVQYAGIVFCGLLFSIFLSVMLHISNNPPMLFSFAVVLLAILLSIGISIYHLYYQRAVSYSEKPVTVAGEQFIRSQVMAAREKALSAIFQPMVTVSLFMLLFLGLTIKTF